jgi:L-fuculose-phosphate aldolase
MAVIVRGKDEYTEKSAADMNKHLDAAQWSARQKLALACRILAAEEHGSALAGQLTTRGDRPGTYWTMRFGLGLDEISADNLLLVDDDLRVLEGDGMPNPSNRFHLWIYRQRPEVGSIIHTHPPYTSALSMIGEPLAVAHMDTGCAASSA